jgi:hypothetical protein
VDSFGLNQPLLPQKENKRKEKYIFKEIVREQQCRVVGFLLHRQLHDCCRYHIVTNSHNYSIKKQKNIGAGYLTTYTNIINNDEIVNIK